MRRCIKVRLKHCEFINGRSTDHQWQYTYCILLTSCWYALTVVHGFSWQFQPWVALALLKKGPQCDVCGLGPWWVVCCWGQQWECGSVQSGAGLIKFVEFLSLPEPIPALAFLHVFNGRCWRELVTKLSSTWISFALNFEEHFSDWPLNT